MKVITESRTANTFHVNFSALAKVQELSFGCFHFDLSSAAIIGMV
jgi:hypothetical protein